MRNWSVNEEKLKLYPKEYKKWWHEQALMYGLDKDEKLDGDYLRDNLEILEIDESLKNFVRSMLLKIDKP